MKYKVGDRVKVRSWADMEQEFGLTEYGNIKIPALFSKEMKIWCNKVVTIKAISINYYFIKDDEYLWTDDMIDHAATKVISIIDRLEMLKKLTSNKMIKNKIDFNIRKLRSKDPHFSNYNINYYNNIFRKIKAGKLK